jgi:hypothetical protein
LTASRHSQRRLRRRCIRWRLNAATKNVSDERCFETGGFGSFMAQAPRHALASLHVTF